MPVSRTQSLAAVGAVLAACLGLMSAPALATPTPVAPVASPTATPRVTQPSATTAKPSAQQVSPSSKATPEAAPTTPAANPTTPAASPTATPTPELTFTRERLRAQVFPPATATAPAVMQVEGPAARAIGGIVIDTTTQEWVGELKGHIGSGGIGTLQFAAPAGGWKAGHNYYFQAFTPDGSTNAVRGGFEVRAGAQDPDPAPTPGDAARPVVTVRTPTCSGEAATAQVTGAAPGAEVEIVLLTDASSIRETRSAVADANGTASVSFAAPSQGQGWRDGQGYTVTAGGSSASFTFRGGACEGSRDNSDQSLRIEVPTCTTQPARASVETGGAWAEFGWTPDGTSNIVKHLQQGGDPATRVDTYLPEGGFKPGARYHLFVTSPAGAWSGEFVAPTVSCATDAAPAAQTGSKAQAPARTPKSDRGGLARTGH